MEWHCAQWVRTNVRPRCAADDWARTGLLADARKAPTAIIIQRCLAGYVGATLVCPLLYPTSKPGDPPERFSRHLVASAFGQWVGSQSGERRRVGTIFLPSRIGRFRCELVRASSFASTDRTHPLKISHDLRLDFRDFLSIELDLAHPRIQQIRGIRPFASESEELGSADAYVAGDALRFGITATIKIGHRPASAAPVLPPMRNPANKARLFICLSRVGYCNLHTVRVSRPTH